MEFFAEKGSRRCSSSTAPHLPRRAAKTQRNSGSYDLHKQIHGGRRKVRLFSVRDTFYLATGRIHRKMYARRAVPGHSEERRGAGCTILTVRPMQIKRRQLPSSGRPAVSQLSRALETKSARAALCCIWELRGLWRRFRAIGSDRGIKALDSIAK